MNSYQYVKLDDSINQSDYEDVLAVLNYYNIIPDDIKMIRSVYKVKYKGYNLCLKKIRHGDMKALKSMKLVEYLKKNDFDNTADFITTSDGKEGVKYKGCFYYVTSWIDGRECNFNDLDELLEAMNILSDFHIKSKGFGHKGIKMSSSSNWIKTLSKQKTDLDGFKSIIDSKKIKGVFDSIYLNNYEIFSYYYKLAISLLNMSNYMKLHMAAQRNKIVCHDSFYYQNLLKSEDGKLYLIDLDSTIYDIYVYDLAKLLRRILYKSPYQWNFEVARRLIEEYEKTTKLSEAELEIILAFLIVPHKFWKTGRKYYRKDKKWREEKYIKKLNKIVKYLDSQKKFVVDYCKHYNLVEPDIDFIK